MERTLIAELLIDPSSASNVTLTVRKNKVSDEAGSYSPGWLLAASGCSERCQIATARFPCQSSVTHRRNDVCKQWQAFDNFALVDTRVSTLLWPPGEMVLILYASG